MLCTCIEADFIIQALRKSYGGSILVLKYTFRNKRHFKVAFTLKAVSSAATNVPFFGEKETLARVRVPNIVSIDDIPSSCELEKRKILLHYCPLDVIEIF